MGYGLGSAGGAALNSKDADRRTIAIMGDGGFWHNGLTSGVGNAVFNKNDQLLVVVDNAYSAATGGQDVLSSQAESPLRSTQHPIEKAVRGIGVSGRRPSPTPSRWPSCATCSSTRSPPTSPVPKVIVAQSECQLNRQRRVDPERAPGVSRRQTHRQGALRGRLRDLHRRPRVHPDLRAARR